MIAPPAKDKRHGLQLYGLTQEEIRIVKGNKD